MGWSLTIFMYMIGLRGSKFVKVSGVRFQDELRKVQTLTPETYLSK